MSRLPPPVSLHASASDAPDSAAMRDAYPTRRGRGAGILAVAAAHLLLGWFLLTSSPPMRDRQAPTARSRPEIQWLLPQQAAQVREPISDPVSKPIGTPRSRPAPAPARRPASAAPVRPAPSEAISLPAAEPAAAAAQEEEAPAPAAPLNAAQLVRDLKLTGMASGLDGRGKANGAAAMSLESKLAAGIARAHTAGDTGWMKSNGVEEISSTDGNGTRVYRMRSMFGTFCVYVTNDGKPPVTGKCR